MSFVLINEFLHLRVLIHTETCSYCLLFNLMSRRCHSYRFDDVDPVGMVAIADQHLSASEKRQIDLGCVIIQQEMFTERVEDMSRVNPCVSSNQRQRGYQQMTFLKSKQVCKLTLTIDTSTKNQNYVLYIQKVRLIYKKRQMS